MNGRVPADGRGDWPSGAVAADGSSHDRQALVVDSGPAALVTAGFLDQAGVDPVLASGPGGRSGPAVLTLWRPGLELLERLGMRRPVEAVGTELAGLGWCSPAGSWRADAAGGPVAVRRSRFEELLDRHLGERVHTPGRPVVTVEPTGAGVRATFEGGVSEPFDAVVTADRRLVPGHRVAGTTDPVHWWSFDWPASVPGPDGATETWGESRAAFATPAGETTRVVLVATDGACTQRPLSIESLEEAFGHLGGSLSAAVAGVDESALRYGQSVYADPVALCVDNVALVGPAARAAVPGGCLGPALAIEDGWVLADALAYGPTPVGDALDAYATRRRRRLAAIAAATRDDALVERLPAGASGRLRDLCARRTLAFGRLFQGVPGRFSRGIPRRL
jgi:2-polyprenyl-6-methoxyphenol hydroxylase-like FAD-dependent oxidoreductase